MSDLYIPNKDLVLPDNVSKAMTENTLVKNYKSKREKLINSEAPKIELLHNNVLVRAVTPYMIEKQNGILVNKVIMSHDLAEKMEDMTYNADDIQEILLVGNYVEENTPRIKPGKFAKIDYGRFKTVRNGKNQGHTDVVYMIPVVEFNNDLFLLIDSRDIQYVIEKDNVDKRHYTND